MPNQCCVNPWCADYKHAKPMPIIRKKYVCHTCGCRFNLDLTFKKCLKVDHYLRAVFDFYQLVKSGVSFSKAARESRLPNSSNLIVKLKRFGLAVKVGPTKWIFKEKISRKFNGYAVTPGFAVHRTIRWQDDDMQHLRMLRMTIKGLIEKGSPLTLTAMGRSLGVHESVIYRQLRYALPNKRLLTQVQAFRRAQRDRPRRDKVKRLMKDLNANVQSLESRHAHRLSVAKVCKEFGIGHCYVWQHYPAHYRRIKRVVRDTVIRQRAERLSRSMRKVKRSQSLAVEKTDRK